MEKNPNVFIGTLKEYEKNINEKKNVKKEKYTQTSLFEFSEEEPTPQKNEVEEKIKEINPLEMTPMEALNYLYDLKKEIQNK